MASKQKDRRVIKMNKKKFIYQIIGLDSKYRYLYIIPLILITFLDFFLSVLFNYEVLQSLILKYTILFTYYLMAITITKKLPNHFKKFVNNNPEIFKYKKQQEEFEKSFERSLNSSVEHVFFIGFIVIYIIFTIIYLLNCSDIYLFFGLIRGSNIFLFIVDFITSLLAILFFISPFYFLFNSLLTIRMLGSENYIIRVDYQTLRLNKLKEISKWHFYGMTSIMMLQIPNIIYFIISEFYRLVIFNLLSILMVFSISIILLVLYDIKPIRDKIRKYKRELKDSWMNLIQEEFKKPMPDYLKISSLEIILEKLAKVKNWPIGRNFSNVLIITSQIIIYVITIIQFVIP